MKYTIKDLKEKYWEFKKGQTAAKMNQAYPQGSGVYYSDAIYIPDTLEGFLMWLEEK